MPKITINKNTGTDYKIFSEIFYRLENAAKLDVAGNLSVGGNTIVCGEIQTDNITIKNSGALDLSGNLTVSNNVDISGNLGVVGDASFCNIIYVNSIAEKTIGSNITFLDDVDISGNITLEDIDISGNATICGDLYIDDIGEKTPGIGLAIHNDTDISGNLVVAGGLEVLQDASYCGVVYTNYLDDKTDGSGITINTNIDVSGNVSSNDIVSCGVVYTNYLDDKTDGSGITINTNIDVSGNVCADELLVDTISSKTGNGVCITNTFTHAYDTENQNNMNFSTTNTTNDTISSISDTSDNQGAIGVNTIDFRTITLPWVCEMYVEQFTENNLFIGLIESTFLPSSSEIVSGNEGYYINCSQTNDTLTGSWSKEVIATSPIILDTDISGNDTSKGYRFTVNSDSSGYNLTLEFTDNSGSSWSVVNDDASGLPISILIDETKKYKIFSWDQNVTSSSIGTRVSGSYDSYGLRVDTNKIKIRLIYKY